MSWFKKLFQVFKSEEDEYIEESHSPQQEGNRDVDVKVAYQYPKGQFRFPLIPDDSEEKRSRKRSTSAKPPVKPVKPGKSPQNKKPEPTLRQEKVVDTRTTHVQKKTYSSRGFQRTEIPSPIYGYERNHQKKSEPVEFELNGFSSVRNKGTATTDDVSREEPVVQPVVQENNEVPTEATINMDQEMQLPKNKGPQESVKIESTSERAISPWERELNPESSQESQVEAQDKEMASEMNQNQGSNWEFDSVSMTIDDEETLEGNGLELVGALVSNEDPELQDNSIIEPENMEPPLPTVSLEIEVAERQESELKEEHELDLEKSNHLEELKAQDVATEQTDSTELDLLLERAMEEEELEYSGVLEEFSGLDDQDHAEVLNHEDDLPQYDQVLEIEKEEFPKYEVDIQLEDSVNAEESITVSTGDESVEKDSDNLEVVENKKRSHIPFNVIMLKEDKRKLEERKREKVEELIAPLDEVAVSTEVQVGEVEGQEEAYYVYPSMDLLKPPVFKNVDKEWLETQEQQLNETLFHFNVRASVANVTQGPSVTRFEVHPEPGVKVNKITNLADDIKLSLAAKDIRMEAPIPGTHMIGIEVPNETSRPVLISEIINSEEFSNSASPLTAVLGLDISGQPIVTDLRKMPHGLIAGATGSGKSVCINSILVSLLYKADPNEVKLLLIDPKMVELAPYNQIPHLVSPVITDVKAATAALKWAVDEMERRYELFAHAGVREITRFNEIAEKEKRYSVKLPFIVIVIDELADLMMMSPADVEEAICRIAQKARACGIHLIIATQRPSVDVITGLIKANVPTRIAFSVSSQIDSRTIIDISGAERLLGKGDMLFLENGSSKPVRLQGTFVSDEEIDSIVAHVRREQSPNYLFEQEELLKKATVTEEEDELFYEACEYIIEQGGASTSSLQRKFKIGYNRAARLIDMMENQGFISEAKGSKPRDVLITEAELETFHDE